MQDRHAGQGETGRSARSAGRGGLVRQAVHTLLMFPASAQRLSPADRGALDAVDEPGVDILRELLDSLQTQPATSTAQLLERWRDHPAGERLARLAVSESIVPDERAAGDELLTAVQKLAQAPAGAELDALLAKSRESGLDGPENDRLLQLLREARPAPRQ
jgi:DNA primase